MWSCPWSYSNYLNGFSAWNLFQLKHPPVLPTGHIQFATSNETVNVPLSSFRVTIRDGVRHWSDAHRHVCHTDAMTVSHGQERVLNDVEDPVFMKQPTGQLRMESPYICLILFSFSLFALKGQKKYSFFCIYVACMTFVYYMVIDTNWRVEKCFETSGLSLPPPPIVLGRTT